ncbi:ATP-dependent DNA helicase [Hydrocarboniphaga sp.]|uniref:ATP-dependent DNA helicase n=1 Tax=Hydrocarboniphaga sp. TaxID=2033016 RepID=UPI003D116725
MTRVAVRELCEFGAKRGDLDLRFTPSPTSQEGIAGHKLVAGRRGPGYQREITLQTQYKSLLTRGRADGLRVNPELVLEEIKTHRGDLGRVPENHRHLHWAQLKVYGAQLCAERGLSEARLSLIYFDVDKKSETPLSETFSAESLQAFYAEQCDAYIDWDALQNQHKRKRDAALRDVPFPHANFHAGQRLLAEAIYKAVLRKTPLLAQAPTGIGKSIGTLFPALKAMAQGHLDKIFFLTAKTSGRQMALNALASLQHGDEPLPLRVLELTARDKACVHREKSCHGASCPLAKGFYDRLAIAREDALNQYTLDQAAVRAAALRHNVCPYYLAQELVRWVDVVIGDYNYYFDASALLHSLTQVNDWRVAVLVDEAHNLVERGRAMYSVQLVEQDLPQVKGSTHRATARALNQLASDWRSFSSQQKTEFAEYQLPPQTLTDALQRCVAALGEYYTEHPDAGPPHLQRFYFDALHFLELAENFGPHSVCDLQVESHPHMGQTNSTISIRNVVPARYLIPRFRDATSSVLFSATLNPPHFYMSLLGLGEDTAWLDVPSPFASSQIELHIAGAISTRYRDRAKSVAPIADLIAAQYEKRPGNYLAFFSSYDYLRQVHEALAQRHPLLATHAQKAGMSELEQSGFLARFTAGSELIGFAVLGGAFAEGVDLPGDRLIGAFVATLGLPQFNPVNELMRERLTDIFGEDSGYDYAYLYPGLQKVVQAAGRVIRSRDDRGTIHLIDDRYTQRRVREVLPAWWGG